MIYKNSLFKYSQENKCFFQELEKPLNENCKTFFDIIGGVMSSSFVNKRIDKNPLNRDSEADSATEKNKSEKKKVVSTYMS